MANSSDTSAGATATAAQYNDLRADVLNTTTGHTHDGTNSRVLATVNATTGHKHSGGANDAPQIPSTGLKITQVINSSHLFASDGSHDFLLEDTLYEGQGTSYIYFPNCTIHSTVNTGSVASCQIISIVTGIGDGGSHKQYARVTLTGAAGNTRIYISVYRLEAA